MWKCTSTALFYTFSVHIQILWIARTIFHSIQRTITKHTVQFFYFLVAGIVITFSISKKTIRIFHMIVIPPLSNFELKNPLPTMVKGSTRKDIPKSLYLATHIFQQMSDHITNKLSFFTYNQLLVVLKCIFLQIVSTIRPLEDTYISVQQSGRSPGL